MKLSQVMIAAAALVAAAHAQADVARITGASASLVNMVKALQQSCKDSSGTSFVVYKDNSATTDALSNVTTAVCDVPMDTSGAGSNIDQVRIDVSGGSENAVINATAGGAVPVTFLNPASCTSVTTLAASGVLGQTGFLDGTALGQLKNCVGGKTDSATSDGGLLDVEGPVFSNAYDAGDFQAVGFSQAFGVAVNQTLYNALQAHQKTVAGGNIVPATCAAGDATAACQPSLSRGQITALMNADLSNDAKTLGGAYLVPGAGALKIEYCARPKTSGTQQSAELYFLGKALSGDLGGAENLATYGISTSKYAISSNSSSGNVRSCVANATGYRFGVLSLENNPLSGAGANYRFVRINEVAGAEGTGATDTNTRTAVAGRYDFVYESVKYCPAGTCHPILDEITNVLPSIGASATPGLYLTGVESKFGRNGNSAAPYITR